MVHSCIYKKRKEKCLLKDKYPISKNGKIDKKRIRAANNYAAKLGEVDKIKRGGICRIAKRQKIDLKIC